MPFAVEHHHVLSLFRQKIRRQKPCLATADDAIHSETAVAITGGTIDITSCYEGIDSPTITIDPTATVDDATINIVSSGDGISAVSLDGSSSTVSILGGDLNITAGEDGIQAEAQVLITDGNITVTTGGGSTQATYLSGAGTLNLGGWSGDAFRNNGRVEAIGGVLDLVYTLEVGIDMPGFEIFADASLADPLNAARASIVITQQPVPLPAAGVLLLSGLLGAGVQTRRHEAAGYDYER